VLMQARLSKYRNAELFCFPFLINGLLRRYDVRRLENGERMRKFIGEFIYWKIERLDISTVKK
jgi:hypothetical protein